MLSAFDISFERNFEPVFLPVSFVLNAGEILLVTGDNGSGKTTLLRILAGILSPSQGKVENGFPTSMYLGHLLAVKDDLDVLENISFMQNLFPGSHATPRQLAAKMGIGRVMRQPARTLSAGQRKRCALSRLNTDMAGLWLLDEPYSNLDDEGMGLVNTMLAEHVARGGACIMATHGNMRPVAAGYSECRLERGQETP